MALKEFLEYVSEGLCILSLIFYFIYRPQLPLPFNFIDIAYFLAICSFLWSRGYAEYLERKIDQLQEVYKKNYKLIEYQS